ncbi:head GIN domain-containing protein [Flavobacterium sp. GT3R68]|uniref:head GIN domain-containing protein n=1 Tax=Flavobacterium sp. GT3R68 TaxID=2594437 RepID=UPI000F8851AE|nr:head GIN domain-containing protein [Flavobacterium sp. GT3R68]RTY93421.1 DUF2807 domain-containing protein [Flavobacterium sp. GSN2]TRW92406.1 DUF2807 domain-containing protein [Flavobacterium sp. GT3R68]
MINFLKLSGKVAAIASVALVFTSCKADFGGIDGNGNVTTENRSTTGDFASIEASNGLDVYLEQSAARSITVEADQNLQEHIITKVENGVLIVETDVSIDESKAKKITVKLPNISSVKSTSGSRVSANNILKSEALKLDSASGSEIELALEVDTITCEASSGSNITISGKALSLQTSSSSGSEINAEKLLANEVSSHTSSGSSTSVHPIVSLKAKASSGSSINYNNIPKSIAKEENSGGSISQE